MVSRPVGNQDLLRSATSQFDILRKNSRLFWEESIPEYVEHEGFKFQFRIVPAFTSKPLPKKGSNQPAKGKDPFTDLEDGFVLSYVETSHVLQFNKFCIFRPQLILHTKEFAPQTEDLKLADFIAGLDVLKQLSEPWVLFYNCGLRAGSSQGHKHMQLIPKPKEKDFILFPDCEEMRRSLADRRPKRPPPQLCVPYDCLTVRLDASTVVDDLYSTYQGILEDMRQLTRVESEGRTSGAHNVVMTSQWMCIIPRQSRGEDGIYTNAMGMMGMIWVKDKAEREGWNRLHLTDELRAMGVPVQKSL